MQKNHNEPEMPSSVFVALVGRPNVGKSSLTNHLVGEKVAIVTQKAQTTRNRITGIITKGPVQYVLLDTPGIHKPRNRLDSRMTQTAAARCCLSLPGKLPNPSLAWWKPCVKQVRRSRSSTRWTC